MNLPFLDTRLRSLADTQGAAAKLAPYLKAGDILALEGDLGAGKTTFVRFLSEALGLKEGERVSSPTYTLLQEYALRPGTHRADLLIHMDLYRLHGDDDLLALGFEDFLDKHILAIEWPGQADMLDSLKTFSLSLALLSDQERQLQITAHRPL